MKSLWTPPGGSSGTLNFIGTKVNNDLSPSWLLLRSFWRMTSSTQSAMPGTWTPFVIPTPAQHQVLENALLAVHPPCHGLPLLKPPFQQHYVRAHRQADKVVHEFHKRATQKPRARWTHISRTVEFCNCQAGCHELGSPLEEHGAWPSNENRAQSVKTGELRSWVFFWKLYDHLQFLMWYS